MKHSPFKGLIVIAVIALMAVAVIGLFNIHFETNIVNTLPKGNEVMDQGTYVFLHHPYQNQVFIDLGLEQKNPDKLVEAVDFVENELRKSNLFESVGMEEMGGLFVELIRYVTDNLPVLFSADELNRDVAPLLKKGRLEELVTTNLGSLYTMESTGRSGLAIKDPLALSNLVMKKLKSLVPAQAFHFYKGRLLSTDERHIFILANPQQASTGSDSARRIRAVINGAAEALEKKYQGTGLDFTLTPVGAYRAVLDNETMARQDAKRAVLFVTLGIACLLALSFPRPYIGLLALLPSLFGMLCALAFYSIWHRSISIMTVGFGGTIMAFTVDYGIAYLLFLDRPYETRGKTVSREVRAVGLLALLTTVGAFLMLNFSGFPILIEIGQFAALGCLFSFFFVHTCFPLVFPALKPARRKGPLPLQSLVDKLMLSGGKIKIAVAAVIFLILACFAYPRFDVDIATMNTVSQETLTAEETVSATWGQRLFDRVYLMAVAPDENTLQQYADRLADGMVSAVDKGVISDVFVPSAIFPGERRCRHNLEAWRTFWGRHDREHWRERIQQAAEKMGLPAGTFDDVYSSRSVGCNGGRPVDPRFYDMLGIHHSAQEKAWMLFMSLTPGDNYDPKAFFRKYAGYQWLHVLDPVYYTRTISEFLFTTFIHMLAYIGISVAVLLLIFFLDPLLTAVALMPIGFSMVCTLGVLGVLNKPLSVPGLMLLVVVIGIGIDYSTYLVCGYQRYRDETHPYLAHIRMTIFLAGLSTLMGFGALACADHNFMRSLGQVLVLGSGFVLAGTFTFVPSVLRHVLKPVAVSGPYTEPGSELHKKRIRRIYRYMEVFPRMFARFKMMIDPMFEELPELVGKPAVVMDVGCGYGVTAAWLIAMDPQVRICAMDPDPERARITGIILNSHGVVFQAGAPALPEFREAVDLVLMLDMVHYLTDEAFEETLRYLRPKLAPAARIIIRTTVPFTDRLPLLRRIEEFRLKWAEARPYFRTAERLQAILTENGFSLLRVQPSGEGREEQWFIARVTSTNQQAEK